VDDRNSLHYNRIVDSRNVQQVDWKSSERMQRADELYRWGVVVDHNYPPAEPGGGSCIFLHIWRSPDAGTAGCTAMSPETMQQLIGWLDPAAEPVLVQLPHPVYAARRQEWQLPALTEK
jgi:D-alanyl-D-alanine dipeptidase